MKRDWTFKSSRDFWHLPDLSLGAKGVFHILRSYTDKQNRAWPTKETLANNAQISINTLDKFLDELREAKSITWSIAHKGQSKRRVYIVQ